jgi:DNA-3-methyladenine glycosylase
MTDAAVAPSLSLDRSWFDRPATVLARDLLGCRLVADAAVGGVGGTIVETEAYQGPEDRAAHSWRGRTPRNSVMFGEPGHLYVYLVYGLHHCLNVVCGPEGQASAVLIRAVEPLAGIARMRQRRGRSGDPEERLGAGPARACQALDIDRRLDGIDLLADPRLWLAAPTLPETPLIVSGARIGVDYAGADWASRAWRFGIAGHASLSRPFPG